MYYNKFLLNHCSNSCIFISIVNSYLHCLFHLQDAKAVDMSQGNNILFHFLPVTDNPPCENIYILHNVNV